MTEPIHIEETTIQQLAEVLVSHNKHSKLARSAAEFFIREHTHNVGTIVDGPFAGQARIAEPKVDTRTLRRFINYLINEKNYN